MTERIYCLHCGTRLDPTESVCRHCGAASHVATTAPTEGPPSAEVSPEIARLAKELSAALAPRIQVLRPFGHGGMGVVFLGRDPVLRRLVVIKVLAPELANDENSRARFSREAQAAAAVSHPNVVSVYEVGQLKRSRTSYFVMQFVDGNTLGQEVPPGHAVPELKARRLVGEVASALAAAHARGLIHRDVKLSNIMLERESGRAVVLDFGISAAVSPHAPVSEKLTAQGTTVGTPQYMSPEQASGGQLTDKSDVYSLGVVAYELVTGRLPFSEDNAMAIAAAHLLTTPQKVQALRPEIDPAFAALIEHCLSKDPRARPAAAEVARALLPATHPIVEWPPPGLDRLHGAARRMLQSGDQTVLVGLAFFLTLALQPNVVPGLWLFLASLGVGGFFFLYLLVGLRATGLGGQLRWARRSGYPLGVLADVALDNPADGSALINGLDIFATIPEPARRRLLALRRWAALASFVALLAAAVLPALWALGFIGTRLVVGALIPVREAALLFLPSLGCLAVKLVLLEPERRVRRRLSRRRREEVTLKEPPPMRREVVNGWLQSAGREAAPPPTRMQTWVARELMAVPMLPLLVLLGTITLVSMMIIFTWDLASVRQERERWTEQVAGLEGWRRLDSLLAISAAPPRRIARPDTIAARRLLSMESSTVPAVVAATSADSLAPGPVPFDAARIWSIWRVFPGPLPDSLALVLAADTMDPGLRLWRRVATSPPLPAAWYAPADLSALNEPGEVGARSLTVLSVHAMRNVAAAALELGAGRQPQALERAREILAAGRHLARDPVPATHQRGLALLRLGARTMAQIALVTGDPAVGREAEALQDAIDGRRTEMEWYSERAAGLAMTAPDSTSQALLADTTRAPADRWALVTGIALGFCWNGKEILLGPAPERTERLRASAHLAADIARTAQWAELNRRWMETLSGVSAGRMLSGPMRAAVCESVRGRARLPPTAQ